MNLQWNWKITKTNTILQWKLIKYVYDDNELLGYREFLSCAPQSRATRPPVIIIILLLLKHLILHRHYHHNHHNHHNHHHIVIKASTPQPFLSLCIISVQLTLATSPPTILWDPFTPHLQEPAPKRYYKKIPKSVNNICKSPLLNKLLQECETALTSQYGTLFWSIGLFVATNLPIVIQEFTLHQSIYLILILNSECRTDTSAAISDQNEK